MTEPKGIMAKMSAAIVTEAGYKPIQCVMYYAENNPFEVIFASAEETDNGEPVEWHYGRDLIANSLLGEEMSLHGEGDVITSWEGDFFFTMLQAQGNRVVVAFIKKDMEIFLRLTSDLIPLGAETLADDDVDAALRELLGE